MRAVLFLHIPKTSGSSCNRLMLQAYGADNFIGHAEYRLPAILSRRAAPIRVDGLSAHVPLCRWSLYRGADAYACITVLRDPWARLVSHINWYARFLDGRPMPVGCTASAVRRVVQALGQTDFDSRESLRCLMAQVAQERQEVSAFDNMQVRMLMTGPPGIAARRQIGGPELAMALANLRSFALVGFCEDQAGFRAGLRDLLGLTALPEEPVHENAGRVRLLSPDNALAREVLEPWVVLDQSLYERVHAG